MICNLGAKLGAKSVKNYIVMRSKHLSNMKSTERKKKKRKQQQEKRANFPQFDSCGFFKKQSPAHRRAPTMQNAAHHLASASMRLSGSTTAAGNIRESLNNFHWGQSLPYATVWNH